MGGVDAETRQPAQVAGRRGARAPTGTGGRARGAGASANQVWKDLPQPQPLLAFGFLIVNPS